MKNTKTKGKRIFLVIVVAFAVFGFWQAFDFFFEEEVLARKDRANVGVNNADDADFDLANLEAKVGADLEYAVDRNTSKATFITNEARELSVDGSNVARDSKSVAAQAAKEYGVFFGINDSSKELSIIGDKRDDVGMNHVWFGQKYAGVPVFGSQMIVHLEKNLLVTSINGKTVPNISVDVKAKISKDGAVERAKELWKKQFKIDEAEVLKNDLFILNKEFVQNKPLGKNHLVWQIELYNKDKKHHEFYYIDAHDGNLVYQITGTMELNRRSIDCSLGTCALDYSFGGYVYGRSEGSPARGANPSYGGTDVDDLYDITGSIHTYLLAKFSLNGANGLGGIGDGSSSAAANTDGYNYIDPVWSGCPNAFFDGFSINFCDGLVHTDIVAHEYGHAVVEYGISGGLTYSYESGALNEGYADITGEAVEFYRNSTNDWLMGASISVAGLDSPLRSIKDPDSITNGVTGEGYPDSFYSPGFYCGTSDGGGVHINSTVPSHAAYLMAVGGTHNGCTVDAIGRDKEERIYYRAVTSYFTSSTDFNGAYTAINSACSDLYGSGSSDCGEVRDALQSVEMDQGGACSSDAEVTPECADSNLPSFSDQNPSNHSSNISKKTDINFKVKDNGSGINKGSIKVTVNGKDAISRGSFKSGYSGSISAIDNGYSINIDPDNSFAYGKKVEISASASDLHGNSGSASWSFTIVKADPKIIAVTGSGEDTKLQIYDRKGNARGPLMRGLFPSSYRGGAGVVAIDGESKGIKNQVAIYARAGGGPMIRIFKIDERGNRVLKGQMFVFDKKNNSGISVTVGDFDNDDFDDDIATCLTGGNAPVVRVYKNARGINNWKMIGQFKAPYGNVGCNLGTFQYDSGADEILVSPYQGPSSPYVYIYTVGGTPKKIIAAYGGGVRDGLMASGIGERIYTTANGGSAQVNVFDKHGRRKNFWWAYNRSVHGNFVNTAGDIDGDGVDEILTAPVGKNGSQVVSFEPSGRIRPWPRFFAFSSRKRNGVGITVVDKL